MPRPMPESLPSKIVERVLPKLDLDQLADAIAAKLSDHIIGSFKVDSITDTFLLAPGFRAESLHD